MSKVNESKGATQEISNYDENQANKERLAREFDRDVEKAQEKLKHTGRQALEKRSRTQRKGQRKRRRSRRKSW